MSQKVTTIDASSSTRKECELGIKEKKLVPILWYVPKEQRKEGESPSACSKDSKVEGFEGLNMPITKIEAIRSSSPPLERI